MHLNRLWHKGVLRMGFCLILLVLCGCAQAVQVVEPPEDTLTPSPLPSITASRTASLTPEPTSTLTPRPTRTPQPTATQRVRLPLPLLPAPLYFISADRNGIDQVWRMEMHGGLSNPVTRLSEDVTDYDVSKYDGALAFVSGNDLYMIRQGTSIPELVYKGEELDPEEEWGLQVSKMVYNPLWSHDGKELAFSQDGVRVINFETNKIRTLITNNTIDLEDPLDWEAYSPRQWSADGKSIAVRVTYYESGGLILLSASDGSMKRSGDYGCCGFSFPENSRYFYVVSSGYHGGGFCKVDWLTGTAEWLVRQMDPDNFLEAYDPVVVDDTLYFIVDDTVARASIQNIHDYEAVEKAPYLDGRILWAPDASLLIVQDWVLANPMKLWSPGAGLFELQQRGKIMKWGQP
jgi:hypothetical protein